MNIINDLPRMVHDALARYGKDVTVSRKQKGDYDPDTDSYSQTTQQTTTGKGFLVDYHDKMRREGVVDMNDRKLIVLSEGMDFKPSVGDVVTYEGYDYQVKDVKTDHSRSAYTMQVSI